MKSGFGIGYDIKNAKYFSQVIINIQSLPWLRERWLRARNLEWAGRAQAARLTINTTGFPLDSPPILFATSKASMHACFITSLAPTAVAAFSSVHKLAPSKSETNPIESIDISCSQKLCHVVQCVASYASTCKKGACRDHISFIAPHKSQPNPNLISMNFSCISCHLSWLRRCCTSDPQERR